MGHVRLLSWMEPSQQGLGPELSTGTRFAIGMTGLEHGLPRKPVLHSGFGTRSRRVSLRMFSRPPQQFRKIFNSL